MFKKSIFSKTIALVILCGICTWSALPIMEPKTAEAKVIDVKKLIPGVSKVLLGAAASCLAAAGTAWIGAKTLAQAEGATAVPISTGAGNASYATQTGKELCLDAVATSIAKATLQKFTNSTINWINTGFEGNPLYVRDPASFFKSIADEQIGSITLSIETSGAPFARSLAQSLIMSQLTDFNAAMRYNVDAYLGKDVATGFNADFRVGGWDAWILNTQYPQNNPIGASINVANEVNKKLAGTQKSIGEIAQDEINQGAGFLGIKECVDPKDWVRGTGFTPPVYADPFAGMTPDEFAELTPEERAQIETDASNAYLEYVAEERAEYEKKSTCKRWETRTPGNTIAEQLNISLGSSIRQTELADELNESIAAIIDAVFSKFLTDGLNSLGDNTNEYSQSGFAGYGTNSSAGGTYGTQAGTFSSTVPSSIYSIWTDLDKIITWQNDYITALTQHKNLLETQLIPRIYELDFCVPGPRPDWETKAQEKVSSATSRINDFGTTQTFFQDLFLTIDGDNSDDLESGGAGMLLSIFDQYTNFLNSQWFSSSAMITLPVINTINRSEYAKISNYQNIIENIQDEILETISVLSRVEYIKQQLQGIPNPTTGGSPTATQQEIIIQQQRILDQISGMVAEDVNIQSVKDDILKTQLDIDYIGDKTKGLIKQCVDETTSYPNQNKIIRWPYPQSLLPASVQNTYTPGPMVTTYESGSGELREPTYLKNVPQLNGTGVNTYISYGSGSNCTPTAPYIHISNFMNLADCDSTAGFERYIEIY
jgi:hypothetical protein